MTNSNNTCDYPDALNAYHDKFTVTLYAFAKENDSTKDFATYPEAVKHFDRLNANFDHKKHLALQLHGACSTADPQMPVLLKQTFEP